METIGFNFPKMHLLQPFLNAFPSFSSLPQYSPNTGEIAEKE